MPNETKLAPQQWSFSSTRTQSGFLDKWISVPALLGLSSPIQKNRKRTQKNYRINLTQTVFRGANNRATTRVKVPNLKSQ